MIGAIAGDIIGSAYEFQPCKSEDFPLFGKASSFTDDTVLTVATADAILGGRDYAETYRAWGRRYPDQSYGSLFRQWLRADEPRPYGSYGNGAAMRVSPLGWAFDTLEEVLAEARRSAAATHDHPEGIRGARAAAGCVFLARTGASKDEIRRFVEGTVGYRLDRTLAEIRPAYRFDETCQGSVPEAITAFLESESYEDAVRKAVSLGGDADTQAAIAGGIAEAFYGGVPREILKEVLPRLTLDLGAVVGRFARRYGSLCLRVRPEPSWAAG
ncbi:MAG: ADP-ribosylglycohydrolase family protein [Deferrisomatales bacterium]|nr:ADP-ribosylglycohydrolase family protein [Deferrisomatales bacterium]